MSKGSVGGLSWQEVQWPVLTSVLAALHHLADHALLHAATKIVKSLASSTRTGFRLAATGVKAQSWPTA